MTKTAKKATAEKPDVSAFSAAMIAGHPAASRLWLDIIAESTRFVSERLQNDLETQKAMLRCQTPTELMQLQSEFFRKTVEQYTTEAQRLFEIMTEATEGAVKDTKTSAKRGYDDVPV
ncbi:MAG: phasin family protein [Roseovarius sp.]|nr:phasin family protein [Roseovarius sp.]